MLSAFPGINNYLHFLKFSYLVFSVVFSIIFIRSGSLSLCLSVLYSAENKSPSSGRVGKGNSREDRFQAMPGRIGDLHRPSSTDFKPIFLFIALQLKLIVQGV